MPFYISLVLEYLARQLRKRSFSPSLGFGQKKAQTSSNPLLAALAGAGGGGDMITNTMLSLLMGGGGDSEAKRRERPVSVVEGTSGREKRLELLVVPSARPCLGQLYKVCRPRGKL